MNLNETITFEVTTADSFGDDTVSTSYETQAAVEQASASTRGINAELQTGELIAWIAPDSDVWTAQRYAITGMVAQYEGQTYRVTAARAGGSLLTDEEDLVELTLTKAEVSDGE